MYALEFRKAVVKLYYFFNSMRKTSQALKISIPSISCRLVYIFVFLRFTIL